jgi:aldose sugar dehydrogenase
MLRIWIALLAFTLLQCSKTSTQDGIDNPDVKTDINKDKEPTITNNIVVNNRSIIWGFDFKENGDILFTEKGGKLFISKSGIVTEITGGPTDVDASGQGGLLDIRLHPRHQENGLIYLSYSSAVGNQGQLNLWKGKLTDNALTEGRVIFKTSATNGWKGHYGSRIAFDNKGFLYLSVGEGGQRSSGGTNSPNKNSQDMKEAWGKIHRMTDNGLVPSDNPVMPGSTSPTTIFSYGHRNPQGLYIDPSNNDIWNSEHGPQGGDELNLVLPGRNYGWPLVSYGVNYGGGVITNTPKMEGIEDVYYQWTPSLGACGLTKITSDKYGIWKGDFLLGALALTHLSKLKTDASGQKTNTKLLPNIGRVRNVGTDKEGFIYVSVENPGRIIKLEPSFQ